MSVNNCQLFLIAFLLADSTLITTVLAIAVSSPSTPPQAPTLAMGSINPLKIPEIADMVASYLEGKDLEWCLSPRPGTTCSFLTDGESFK
jgi:hypothetical protein